MACRLLGKAVIIPSGNGQAQRQEMREEKEGWITRCGEGQSRDERRTPTREHFASSGPPPETEEKELHARIERVEREAGHER